MPLLLALPQATAGRAREGRRGPARAGVQERRAVGDPRRSSSAHDGIAETRALARDYAGAARVALGAFPDSEAKEGLLLATESVIDRIR